jgi:hypothetical protein
MKIPQDNTKYTYSWRYVELARYVPSLNRVIREKYNGSPVLVDINDVQKYVKKYNETGIYTSIWHYDSQEIDNSTRLGSLYFDIDNSDIEVSWNECKKLYSYLSNYIPEDSLIVYYTGKKGFHIECEASALGINPANNLHHIFKFIAKDLSEKLSLTSLDFAVYDLRRMWRHPNTKHQDTGLYKTRLNNEVLFSSTQNIFEYSSVKRDLKIVDQEFHYKANEWFREMSYKLEEERNKPKDVLAYFNEFGSNGRKSFSDSDKVFDKQKLLSGCSAVSRIIKEAKEKKHLDHESRLFLCSILTYTEESIQFLHEILSLCDDYNPQKSSAHINDWIKRRELGIGGRPYTCSRANSVGVGCGDCSLEMKNKWVRIGDKYLETNEKNSPSPIRFAYNTSKKGG